MSRVAVPLVLLAVAACDQAGAPPDAFTGDDAVPGLDAFACSLAPPSTAPDKVWADPEYWVEVPGAAYPRAVFVVGGELVLFSKFGVVHATLDGQPGSLLRYADPEPALVTLAQVVVGAQGYGAILDIEDMSAVTTAFCVLDSVGGFDLSRCTTLSGEAGVIAFDGATYQRYVAVDGRLERHTYDDQGAEVTAVDLSPGDFDTESVLRAAITPFAEHILTVDSLGDACGGRVREHVVDPSGHQVRELFAEDVGSVAAPELVADGAGGVSVLGFGACLMEACEPAPEAIGLLTTYDGTSRALDTASEPLMPGVLLRDEARTVLIHQELVCLSEGDCEAHGELTRVRADGTVDGPRRRLIGVILDNPGELTAAVIAPGDYVIFYRRVGPTSYLTRIRLRGG